MEWYKAMNPFRFKCRFALRNIVAKKGSSIVVILTLGIFITLLMLTFSMFSVMKQVYYYDNIETYPFTDVVITYDENSDVRIINNRNLKINYDTEILTADVFLNIHTMINQANSSYYVELMSATSNELERLIDEDVPSLNDRDMVITKSMSDKYDLQVNDVLAIFISNVSYSYNIKAVIEDKGVFVGDTLFVQKATLANDLYGASLDNVGNVVYVNLATGVSPETFIQKLSLDPEYSGYSFTQTVDWTEIARMAKYNSVLFFGVALLMMFALVMVMHSLFILFFKDYPIQSGVMSILGAQDKMLFGIWSIEIGLFLLISSIFSGLLTFALVNIAGLLYGVHHLIVYAFWHFGVAFLITILFLFAETFVMQQKIKKTSKVSLTFDFRYKKHHTNYRFGLIILVLMGLTWLFHPFSEGINAIIIVFLSVIVMFQCFDLALLLIAKIVRKKKKKTLFSRFSVKAMQENPYIHQSIRVLFVIFLVIVSAISVKSFIDSEFQLFSNQVEADYALLGIFDYDPQLKTEIEADFDVSEVDEAIVYQGSLVHFGDEIKKMKFNISMDYPSFLTHFKYETLSAPIFDLDSEYPQVLLPVDLQYIYGVEIGDIISIDLSKNITDIPFEVIGFLDTNFDNLIYTTIYRQTQYEDIVSINTLFIQTDDPETYIDMIQRYSLQMYFVLDMDQVISDFVNNMITVSNMFSFLTGILVVCFVIILFNNIVLIYDAMKSEYAKLKILGLDRNGFFWMICKEATLMFTIMLGGTLIESRLLIPYFPKMMLVFHYYKEIIPGTMVMTLTFLVVGTVFAISYRYYLYRIQKMNVIEETKKY